MTTFLQVKDNVKTLAPSGSFNNTTTPLTVTGIDTSTFPAFTVGFALTIWDDVTYPDPGNDPNMEKVLVTAVTVGASGSITVTRPNAIAHTGTPRVGLLVIAQNISDLNTAVGTAETNIAANATAIAANSSSLTSKLSTTSFSNVFIDRFTDADGVSIASHVPDTGLLWAQTAATSFFIQGNTLKGNRMTDGDIATVSAGLTDFSLTATVAPSYVTSSNKSSPGIVIRYTDASNFWYFTPDIQLNNIKLYQVSAGTSTVMATYPYTQTSGTSFVMRIDCVGADITLWINGAEIFTYTYTAALTSQIVGVRLGTGGAGASTTKCSWDDFQVAPYRGSSINWPVFVKNPSGNPVLPKGTGSQWDATDANNPNIAVDAANNRLVLDYSGYYNGGSAPGSNVQHSGQAYISGLDPTGTWVKDPNNPVISSISEDGIYAFNGGLAKKGSTWYKVYGSNNGGRIRLATSPDLSTWTRQGYAIPLGNTGDWDESGHFDAFLRVRQDGVTFEMWYVGKSSNGTRQLGFATSTDCLNWTKSPLNPIIKPTIWTASNTIQGEPNVFVPQGKEGQEMLISYDTCRGSAANNRMIAQAATVDGGATWVYRMAASQPGTAAWESAQNFDSFVFQQGSKLYLFYGGADTAGPSLNLDIQIGMSTANWPFTSLKASEKANVPDAQTSNVAAALATRVLDLPDVTVSSAGPLASGVTSNVTAAGTYTAPTPSTTLGNPPQRFSMLNMNTASVTLSFPNPSGTTISLLVLPGEVVTFRQKTLSGYANESGNKPKAQLDLLYQAILSSGGNIKTVNGNSLLGSGDLVVSGSGSGITQLTGDATAAGTGSQPITFATVNSNVGSFGSASQIPVLTVNAKGLVTAVSLVNTASGFANPMTTAGDLIYGGTSGAATRLGAGTATQVLLGGTTPAWGAVALGTMVSGTLPIANGGTGSTTQTWVDLTSAQTVAGIKTFSDNIVMTTGKTLGTATRTITFNESGSASGAIQISPGSQAGSSNPLINIGGTFTTFGVPTLLQIKPTISQNSTGGFILLDVNPIQSSIGTGTKTLQQWRYNNGNTLVGIDYTGVLSAIGTASPPATVTATGTLTGYQSDVRVNSTAATTQTLPSGVVDGFRVTIINVSTGAVTVAGTINGATNDTALSTAYKYGVYRYSTTAAGWEKVGGN